VVLGEEVKGFNHRGHRESQGKPATYRCPSVDALAKPGDQQPVVKLGSANPAPEGALITQYLRYA